MGSEELCIEQLKSATFQAGDEMNKGYFARFAFARKHALAEKSGTNLHAIKAAHELTVSPALYGMRDPPRVQLGIEGDDFGIDPGFRMARPRFSACGNDLTKGGIDPDFKLIGVHDAHETLRHVKAVKRNDPAFLRRYPEQGRGITALGHREESGGVSPQQQVRGDFRLDVLGSAAHRG
ncbi:MAG: hypothetical protein JO056_05285 [Alphaproteobacteria bacterium]|nr:hypothetical protein [Alphaproteobacteria bacterium]